MAPTNTCSNKRSRSVPPEAEDDTVVNIKDAILAIDSKSVYAQTIYWTGDDWEAVQSKMKEVQASLDKVKKDIDYQRQKRYKSTSLVPAAAAAAAANPPTVADVTNAVTIVSMETVVQQVAMSGFLSAEDVGRFLLCTCKALTAPLTEVFIDQAIMNSASPERFDHVPRSILEKHGHKWIYEKLLWKNDSEEEAAAAARLMREPTTLSAENLTLHLQIFSTSNNVKVFSLTLAEAELTHFAERSEIAFGLSPEEEPALFEQLFGGPRFNHAIIYGFREDTNQVVRLLDRVGYNDFDDGSLRFMGRELDYVSIHFHIASNPDEDGEVVIIFRNIHDPQRSPENEETDPNYNFFRALHHFAPWKG